MPQSDQLDIVRALGRLEGKLDSLVSSLRRASEHRAELDSRLRTLEERPKGGELGERIRRLEAWRWYLGGGIALLGALLGTGLV